MSCFDCFCANDNITGTAKQQAKQQANSERNNGGGDRFVNPFSSVTRLFTGDVEAGKKAQKSMVEKDTRMRNTKEKSKTN
jgi:hypothetical protein